MAETFDTVDVSPATAVGAKVAGDYLTQSAVVKFLPASYIVFGPQDGPYERVDVGTGLPVAVTSLPLPADAATGTKQDTGNASLASIDGKTVAVNTGAVVVASSALPSGAATATNQTTANTSLAAINTATGAQADAEASGDGSVIGLLKRLRTLLGGTISVDGSGVIQPVSAASLPLPSGAATAARQDAGNTSLASIDAKVAAVNTNAVIVSASALPTGAATSALQGTIIGHVDGIEQLLADIDAGKLEEATFTGRIGEVQASPTANTVLGRLKDLLTGIVLAAGTNLLGKVGLDQTTPGTTNAVAPIAGQAGVQGGSGAVSALTQRVVLATDQPTVPVSLASVPSHAVTNAGTFVVQVDGAGLTSLQLIDDVVFAEDAAHSNGDKGVQVLTVRKDTSAATAGTDGDYQPPVSNARGATWVAIEDGAGGQITSFGGGTQYTEDAAAAANPVGNALIVVRDDARAGSLVSADGDNVALRGNNKGEIYVKHTDSIAVQIDAGAVTSLALLDDAVGGVNSALNKFLSVGQYDINLGTMFPLVGTANEGTFVQGPVAHDAALAGRPLNIGGYAKATAPTDVSANGDAVQAWYLRNGTQMVGLACAGALIGGDATNGLYVDIRRLPTDLVLTDDAAFTPGTSKVLAIGFQADETSPDSVDEGDIGCPRMTLDRKVWTRPEVKNRDDTALVTLLSTGLNSLADGGRDISAADTSGATDLWGDLELAIKYTTAAPAAGTKVAELYALTTVDGTNYPEGSTSLTPQKALLIATFESRNGSTSVLEYLNSYRYLLPARGTKYLLVNTSSKAYAPTGNTLKMKPYRI